MSTEAQEFILMFFCKTPLDPHKGVPRGAAPEPNTMVLGTYMPGWGLRDRTLSGKVAGSVLAAVLIVHRLYGWRHSDVLGVSLCAIRKQRPYC